MKSTKRLYSVLTIILIVIALSFSFTGCYSSKGNNNGEGSIVRPPVQELPNVFTYNYNDATSSNTEINIELEPENYSKKTLIVPKREGYEFDGWYSDWIFKTRVTDDQGHIIIDDNLYKSKSRELYAKWTKEDPAVYPILMVFVTKVDALLKTIDGEEIKVDYSMTEAERKVCELIPPMLKDYLDALLNGAVEFNIDTIFTTQTIGSRSFAPSVGTGLGNNIFHYNYYTHAHLIPELGGMERPEMDGRPPISEIEGDGLLSKYRSIITTFNLNDLNEKLHFVGGSASRKYANIHMESVCGSIIRQGGTPDLLLNFDEDWVPAWWLWFMQLYLHEFTHSVENYWENKEINPIDFHDANRYYSLHGLEEGRSGDSDIEFMRLYLQYQVKIDGKTLGIPNSFWYMN